MAKLAFSKLNLNKNQEATNIVVFNDQEIEVKAYLPVNDKLKLIEDVINQADDGNSYANPVKINIFLVLNILYYYTNLSFTEKQKSDPDKLYDLIVANDLFAAVLGGIPEEEYEYLMTGLKESVKAVYKYRNSFMGMLDTVSADYSNLDMDVVKLQQAINDPNSVPLLKEVLKKLG